MQPDDITQKHQNLILQASGDGIYGIDINGFTTFSNPAAERMTGFSTAELIGKGSHGLVHHSHSDGSHYPKVECPIYATFMDGKVHHVTDEVFWRKDGSCFPVEYVSTPIFDDGKIVGAVVSFRDITERKEAEAALLESEERYRKIVEGTHEAIFLIRIEDGRILDVNDEACEMLGYSREVLLTKVSDDFHLHQMTIFDEFKEILLAKGTLKSDKLSCLASNGDEIPVRVSASVIQLKTDDCILFIAQDMRDYVKAEQQARKLQADLHHGARVSAMGEMASSMAHELNQPLTAVMNYLQACKMTFDAGNPDAPEKMQEYLGKAMDQADRAGKIISGLRSFVRKGDSNRAVEDMNEIIQEASGLLAPNATAEGIEFVVDLAAGLPQIHVDKIQIQQVVFNLVRNGVEALADTKDAQLIISSAQSDDGMVQVIVSDNGPGVADDMISKLFDAFTTTKSDGMGVGLSICKSIVEDHGGKIQADRNDTSGMTFSFTVPGATNV